MSDIKYTQFTIAGKEYPPIELTDEIKEGIVDEMRRLVKPIYGDFGGVFATGEITLQPEMVEDYAYFVTPCGHPLKASRCLGNAKRKYYYEQHINRHGCILRYLAKLVDPEIRR
jgi:hypothetical protein